MQHPGTWYLPWGMPLQKMVAVPIHPAGHLQLQTPAMHMQPMLTGLPAPLATLRTFVATQPTAIRQPQRKICNGEKDKGKLTGTEKRKADDGEPNKDLKKATNNIHQPGIQEVTRQKKQRANYKLPPILPNLVLY